MKHSAIGLCLVMSFLSIALNAQEPPGKAQTSFTPQERENAKAIDTDLAKQCKTNRDECRRAYAMLLMEAQRRLAEWGYGTRFTAEADSDTTAAIRLYQRRNSLPETGKLDGLTVVRMEADEKAVEPSLFAQGL